MRDTSAVGSDGSGVGNDPSPPAAANSAPARSPADAPASPLADGPAVTPSPWSDWRHLTPARIALGRAGQSMPTAEVLRFGAAHARARDAIHAALDVDALAQRLSQAGWPPRHVASQAPDRPTYLRRPDLGRRLCEEDARALRADPGTGEPDAAAHAFDLAIVIADGLSALAVERQAVPFLEALLPRLDPSLRVAPPCLALQARVALGDEVGECLRARLVLVLIGERPGLSSPDSLGLYLTHAPRVGRHDAERNCISNVRPEGLPPAVAAHKAAWLIARALERGLTGVELKDESDTALAQAAPAPALPS